MAIFFKNTRKSGAGFFGGNSRNPAVSSAGLGSYRDRKWDLLLLESRNIWLESDSALIFPHRTLKCYLQKGRKSPHGKKESRRNFEFGRSFLSAVIFCARHAIPVHFLKNVTWCWHLCFCTSLEKSLISAVCKATISKIIDSFPFLFCPHGEQGVLVVDYLMKIHKKIEAFFLLLCVLKYLRN